MDLSQAERERGNPRARKREFSPRTPREEDTTLPTARPAKRRLSAAADSLPSSAQIDNDVEGYIETKSDEDFKEDEGDESESDSEGEESEDKVGDSEEKNLRSFKDIKDNLEKLEEERHNNRDKALRLGVASGIQDWLLRGNRLQRIHERPELLTAQEIAVNHMVDISETSEMISRQIESERKLLHSLSITVPRNAQKLPEEKHVYDETYTLEEALRRSSPLVPSQFGHTAPSWIKPRPVLTGAPIDIMTEGGPGWNPEWLTLDGPEFQLDRFVRELTELRAKLATLGDNATKEARDKARRDVKQGRRIVNEILVIRQYFENGYTIHPNQIVSPKQLPKEGLCMRYLLYHICLYLRQLIAVRDRNKEIGLCMSPVDFLRWRIAVVCKNHDHAGKKTGMRTCLTSLYYPETAENPARLLGRDDIFRQALLRGARLDNHSWHYAKARRRRMLKKVAQDEEEIVVKAEDPDETFDDEGQNGTDVSSAGGDGEGNTDMSG